MLSTFNIFWRLLASFNFPPWKKSLGSAAAVAHSGCFRSILLIFADTQHMFHPLGMNSRRMICSVDAKPCKQKRNGFGLHGFSIFSGPQDIKIFGIHQIEFPVKHEVQPCLTFREVFAEIVALGLLTFRFQNGNSKKWN